MSILDTLANKFWAMCESIVRWLEDDSPIAKLVIVTVFGIPVLLFLAAVLAAFTVFFTIYIFVFFIWWAIGKELEIRQGGKVIKTIRRFTVTNY